MTAGDVISHRTLEGFETVYLLLERQLFDRLDQTRRAHWKCLVLHREDDFWSNGKPGHLMWPSERELERGLKL